MEKLGCVVLAAGNGRRFGGNKLDAALHGRSLILRTLEAVPPASFDGVTVVTQWPEITRAVKGFHFSCVRNERPDLGLSRSIALGLAEQRDCGGVCFLVSDQPLLRRASVAALADFWREAPEQIAALGHGGVRGNPCIFPRRFYPELAALEGDTGGAAVIRNHEDALRLWEVPAEELWDVDTPEALERLKQL